jgi:hypothetical protein
MSATDTSRWAEAAQLRLYQSVGPARRALIAVELSEAARETTLAGIRRRHPDYSEREVGRSFLALLYGSGS